MDIIKAALYRLGSTLAFALMAVQVRALGADFPIGQILFIRAFLTFIVVAAAIWAREDFKQALKTPRLSAHFFRGMTSVAGIVLMFAAVTRLPLADFTAIAFIAPLLSVPLAVVFLKEHVRIYRWSAVIVGFIGVIIMGLPHMQLGEQVLTGAATLGVALAFFHALCVAAATIQVRGLTATESTSAITFYLSVFIMLAGLLTLPFGWRMPTPTEWALLVGIGAMGGTAQITMTESMRYAPASFLAPFDYSIMVWAFLLGYVLLGEVPTSHVLVGASLVAMAGLFVIWRERRLGLQRAADASPPGVS